MSENTLLKYIPTILFSVSLNAAAQLFLRKGLANLSLSMPRSFRDAIDVALNVLNMSVVLGMLCFAMSILSWMYVLSKVQVSVAYPFNSIGYIVVIFGGYFFFKEPLSVHKITGIALICAGVIFVSKP
jgi:multidrug transporter EmrE-like cation transporter